MRVGRRLLDGVLAIVAVACSRGDEIAPPPFALTADQQVALEQSRALVAVGSKADPPRAVTLLTNAFGAEPRHPEAAFLLARAAFRAEQPDGCRAALDAYFAAPAADHVDWTAEAHVLRGWLEERAGRFAEAVPHYAQALSLQPNYAWAAFRTGNALSEAGDDSAALAWVDRALVDRPGLIEAHFLRAQLLRRLGRAEEAVAAAALHALLNQASDNVAATREAMTEKLAALEQLETRLPAFVDGRVQLARLRAKAGQARLALDRLTNLIGERPVGRDAFAAWLELARGQLGDEGTRRKLGRLIASAPTLAPELRAELQAIVDTGFTR
jgi:tetratricopeptide (TPR) repeat protein